MSTVVQGFDQITPTGVSEKLARGENFRFVDVREPLEYAIASVPGAELIPLGAFVEASMSMEKSQEVVVMCHHGIRSARACEFLVSQGFSRVTNVIGGIDRWSVEVDPTIPRY